MRFLLNNLWMKLLALVMGLLIWFHVATEKSYTFQLKLPVVRVDLKEHYTLADAPPDSLMVSVSARGKQLIRSAWQNEGVRINATKLPVGPSTFNLTSDNTSLVGLSKNIRIDEVIFPNPIELNVDVQSKAELPVVADLTAKPDDGFAVSGPIEIVPAKVLVTGAKSVMRGLKSIYTEPRELGSLRNDVVVTVRLVRPKGLDMKLEPDSVIMSVHVGPVRTRVYDRLAVAVYNAPIGRPVGINPLYVQVELSGPPTEIDLLNRNSLTVSADFRERNPVSGMAPIKVDCPANFRVKKVSDDSVRLVSN